MTENRLIDGESTALDDAARAGWYYYVGGKTQDQIAREMGISRQRAQRLVSKAVSEGLIRVRLDHKMAECLALELALTQAFKLRRVRVTPGLGEGIDPVRAVSPLAATELERVLEAPEPIVLALGTGRMLRAAVEELRPMTCPQHRVVSLIGNIAPDGSASFFDVIMRIADKARMPHYPMPLPVIAASPEERDLFHALAPVSRARELAMSADVTFVGVGQMSGDAPLLMDGFLSPEGLKALQDAGAAGEIGGWPYGADGRYLPLGSDLCVAGVRVEPSETRLTMAIAAGPNKVPAIAAALKGGLVNGLITDTLTASVLLQHASA